MNIYKKTRHRAGFFLQKTESLIRLSFYIKDQRNPRSLIIDSELKEYIYLSLEYDETASEEYLLDPFEELITHTEEDFDDAWGIMWDYDEENFDYYEIDEDEYQNEFTDGPPMADMFTETDLEWFYDLEWDK